MDQSPKVVFNSLDVNAEIDISRRNLPHWFQPGAATFITFRTADSLPREVLVRLERELEAWLASRELPLVLATSVFGLMRSDHQQHLDQLSVLDRQEFRKRTDRLFHGGLDECHGACRLRRPESAKIVADAILHHQGVKYDVDRFVVMPNHVHAIVQFRDVGGLSLIGQSWMRYSARLVNPMIGSTHAFWQSEPFDHVIRSAEQFVYLQKYIANNPSKANLQINEYLLWERT